jgi:hypothetical protein
MPVPPHDFVQRNINRAKVDRVELFSRGRGAGPKFDSAATIFFGIETARCGIRVDRTAGPAQYRCVVQVRFAPEVRGTLAFNAVAALTGAGAVFYCAVLPPRADAAALQRWTEAAPLTFPLPDTAGAA